MFAGVEEKSQTMAAQFRKPSVSSPADNPEDSGIKISTADKTRDTTDEKPPVFTTRSILTVSVSWFGLIVIMALRVYLTYKTSEANSKLTAENRDLMETLEQLETQNQQLEAEKKNLTGKLQEEASHGLNVSRAQWSVDQYCRGTPRLCHTCQDGWRNFESQCYAVNDYQQENQRKTWKEAQADCRGKISDLVVINNDNEKGMVSELSWVSSTNNGYWIGLRVMNGTWKWVDGTEFPRSFWYQKPVEGHCAISVQTRRWESVSCDRRMPWLCEKKGLTL